MFVDLSYFCSFFRCCCSNLVSLLLVLREFFCSFVVTCSYDELLNSSDRVVVCYLFLRCVFGARVVVLSIALVDN